MNEIATTPPPAIEPGEPDVYRPSAALDPARLNELWSLSERIARMSTVPMTLKAEKEGQNWIPFEHEAVVANVFAVVEQADRWNVSPFALLACASIVHGRLGFEGKVIAAVLESRFNLKLNYVWEGEGEQMKIYITASNPQTGEIITNPMNGEALTLVGSVSEWKTTHTGSPWRPQTYAKMLSYRGAREWARVFKPSAILGVLGDDELYEIAMEVSAARAREVSTSQASSSALSDRYSPNRSAAPGFNANHVDQLESKPSVAMDTGNKTSEREKVEVKPKTDAGKADERKQAGQPDDTGDQQQPERRTPEIFMEYSKALAGMATDVNVGKQHNAFWEKNGGKPEHKRDVELSSVIFEAHKQRARGEIPVDGLQDDVEKWVAISFEPRL